MSRKSRLGIAFAVFMAVFVLGAVSSPPASAQGRLLATYSAFLGPHDHFNSRGARLTQPWQVIRQDRANFHKFGVRDQGDEWDSMFGSIQNRGKMERMILNGYIDPGAARRIVNSNVWIYVEVYENAINVTVQ